VVIASVLQSTRSQQIKVFAQNAISKQLLQHAALLHSTRTHKTQQHTKKFVARFCFWQ